MNEPSPERGATPDPERAPSRGRPRHAPGQTVAGRYALVRKLGAGGMGTVWLGRDRQLERSVAIKFMSDEARNDTGLRERFRREARAAASLDSKHVVEIFDHGVDDGTPYIVMERLEGEDLRARLKRVGVLGLPEVVDIVVQAGKALQRAEKDGIVHRDLKPANLFLAQVDDEEQVKVLDFGVAKQTQGDDDHATKTGVVLGSPPYMSPEQARGRRLDHRADLWSLAAIAYRALTGHIPFSGESDGDIIVKICTEDPTAASTYVPAFGPELDALFAKAFARAPDDRYQSAHELAVAFCELGGIEAPPTIVATPVSSQALRDPAPSTDGPTTPMAASELVTRHDDLEAETTAVDDSPPSSGRRKLVPLAVGALLALGAAAALILTPQPAEPQGAPSATTAAAATAPVVAMEPEPPSPPEPTASTTVEAAPSTTAAAAATVPAKPPARPRPTSEEPPAPPSPKPKSPWGY